MVPDQVGRLQIFMIDLGIRAHQRQRRLVVKVRRRLLTCWCAFASNLTALRLRWFPLRSPCDPSQDGLELTFCLTIPARMEDARPIRQRSERLTPQVYPSLMLSWRERL
jgi:hypothetical protein